MDADAATRRFPLVARPRPACPPLPTRVAELRCRAERADRDRDLTKAASVFNLAALLASDCGLPELARQWCHDHAAAYSRVPWDVRVARSALEPVVNLARLHIRDGHGPAAFRLLDTLYDAVASHTAADIDGIHIPADLPLSPAEHQQLRQWLWGVHLSDGTRALVSAGQWQSAYQHLTHRNGIGQRMLDGRQVATLARVATGNRVGATELVETTEPGHPWEAAVTACLRALVAPAGDPHQDTNIANMIDRYLTLAPTDTVFDTRLGLSVFDAASGGRRSPVATELVRRTIDQPDGYAARDLLTHADCAAALAPYQRRRQRSVLKTTGLDAGSIPADLRADLDRALAVARRTLSDLVTPQPVRSG